MNEFDIPNAHNSRFESQIDKIKDIIKMDHVIEKDDKLLAALYSIKDLSVSGKTEWFGKPHFQLQGSRMHYDKGITFKTHKHVLNPRILNYTQEAFVVITGKIQIDIYEQKEEFITSNDVCFAYNPIFSKKNIHLGSLVATAGDVIFVWGGFHKLSILEDSTICYEIKSGSFTTVKEDKEFLDV